MTSAPAHARRAPAPAGDARGMTLIELMVALVVFTVGVLAVFQLFPLGMRNQNDDRLTIKANYIAQQEIERLSGLSWGDVAMNVGTHGPTTVENIYTRSYQISLLDYPLDNVKKVEVTVTWKGGARTVRIATYARR